MSTTVASAIRPGLRETRNPSSPHTPSRFISSNYSSPGSGFLQEQDAVVIEFGSRHIKAGFEGEPGPQCCLALGSQIARRVGDYRDWAPATTPKKESFEAWSKQQELWPIDLNNFELGLMEDKIERAIREVYNKYLLTDAGPARLVIVLPSVVPHPILSSILTTLFNRWRFPTITLLPTPSMAAFAAGLRSALVVDIGWHETIVTAVVEYRELHSVWSTRAMKTVVSDFGSRLGQLKDTSISDLDRQTVLTHTFVEDLIVRLAWCRPSKTSETRVDDSTEVRQGNLAIATDEVETPAAIDEQAMVDVDWPSAASSKLGSLPFATFAEPIESTYFAPTTSAQELDDEELPLPLLLYKALLDLSPDARAMCMSRIVVVGGGASIPGLSARVIGEVEKMVEKYGWNPVRGKPVEKRRQQLGELGQGRTCPPAASYGVPTPPGKDYVEERLIKQAAKDAQSKVQGVFRQVESLGSWAGASLLTSLKIKGFVEIERERFLSHGLAGANRSSEVSMQPPKASHVSKLNFTSGGDRSSWTLAGWG